MKKRVLMDWLLLAAFMLALTAVAVTVLCHLSAADPAPEIHRLIIIAAAVMLIVLWLLTGQIAAYLHTKADRVYREEADYAAQTE